MQSFFMRATKTDQTVRMQFDLNLRWAHISECTFSAVVAQMITAYVYK